MKSVYFRQDMLPTAVVRCDVVSANKLRAIEEAKPVVSVLTKKQKGTVG